MTAVAKAALKSNHRIGYTSRLETFRSPISVKIESKTKVPSEETLPAPHTFKNMPKGILAPTAQAAPSQEVCA